MPCNGEFVAFFTFIVYASKGTGRECGVINEFVSLAVFVQWLKQIQSRGRKMCWRGDVVCVKQDFGLVDPYISVFNEVVDVWNLNFGFESTQSLHIGYRVIVFFLQLIQNLLGVGTRFSLIHNVRFSIKSKYERACIVVVQQNFCAI